MKKMILATMIILGFTGVANASPVDKIEINLCGDNSAATVFTRVKDSGWYYLISPDDSSLEGWYYLTPIINRRFHIKNTDSRSIVLLIDYSTYSTKRGKCN